MASLKEHHEYLCKCELKNTDTSSVFHSQILEDFLREEKLKVPYLRQVYPYSWVAKDDAVLAIGALNNNEQPKPFKRYLKKRSIDGKRRKFTLSIDGSQNKSESSSLITMAYPNVITRLPVNNRDCNREDKLKTTLTREWKNRYVNNVPIQLNYNKQQQSTIEHDNNPYTEYVHNQQNYNYYISENKREINYVKVETIQFTNPCDLQRKLSHELDVYSQTSKISQIGIPSRIFVKKNETKQLVDDVEILCSCVMCSRTGKRDGTDETKIQVDTTIDVLQYQNEKIGPNELVSFDHKTSKFNEKSASMVADINNAHTDWLKITDVWSLAKNTRNKK